MEPAPLRRAAASGRFVTTRIMDARHLRSGVLKPGARIAVFDKFLGDEGHPTVIRRRQHDKPAALGGTYRVVMLFVRDKLD